MKGEIINYPIEGAAALKPHASVVEVSPVHIIIFPQAEKPAMHVEASRQEKQRGPQHARLSSSKSGSRASFANALRDLAEHSEMVTSLRTEGLAGVAFENVTRNVKVAGMVAGVCSAALILVLGM